jgi:glycerol-3-phosphate acyltransferase PlsX
MDEEVDGFVTCGPTGVVLISSILVLGKICALRPALACILKGKDNQEFCVVDCGANVECNAERYHDFARLGVAYMKSVGIKEPRVALLSNGEEAGKGSETTKNAFGVLEKSALHFIGNIEGNEVLNDIADVIVCDGMSGNVLLKSIEGTAKRFYSDIREQLKQCTLDDQQQAAVLLDEMVRKYDYNNEGGAILLGVNKPVIKGHGAATADTIFHSIRMAYRLAKNHMVDQIRNEFS